jgi:signal transduction histidine kinase
MRSLFFKIFLWFWAGIAVISAMLVISAAWLRSRSTDQVRWRQRNELTTHLRAQRESELFERQGIASVISDLRTLEQNDSTRDYIFDEEGREIVGRSVPPHIRSVFSTLAQSSQKGPQLFADGRIGGEEAFGPSARKYAVITSFPARPVFPRSLWRFLFEDVGSEEVLRLLGVLLVAGFFCYWLARHITHPLDKLRLAARQIADEHLDVRVDPEVLKRKDELAELGRDFDRMANRIHTLVTSQRRLLSYVSHEFRSPLARLNIALGLARTDANPEIFEHLDRIELETNRLNELIGQLLTLTRANSGIDLRQKRIFDLGALVQEVAADSNYEAQIRNCAVKFDPRFECMVEGSPDMVRGAVENVVRNAVRHTAEGTDVEISLESVDAAPSSRAVIRVCDRGPGVPAHELINIFRPFHRVVNGARPESNGAGLGLAITERTFQLYGGSVTAANAPEGGLIVTLELPNVDSAHPSVTRALHGAVSSAQKK